MKSKQEILDGIADINSPYFCGSALLLSLLPIVEDCKALIPSFDELYPELDKKIVKLIDQDGYLFAYSKEEYIDENKWNEIIIGIDNYSFVIESLDDIISILVDIKKVALSKIIYRNNLMLKNLCRYSLISFFDKENKPDEFVSSANMALLAIRGENND